MGPASISGSNVYTDPCRNRAGVVPRGVGAGGTGVGDICRKQNASIRNSSIRRTEVRGIAPKRDQFRADGTVAESQTEGGTNNSRVRIIGHFILIIRHGAICNDVL